MKSDPESMEDLILSQVTEAVGGQLVGEPDAGGTGVTGVCTNTQTLRPGELFFALRGEHTDGHRYLRQALAAGASAAVVCQAWYQETTERPAGPVIVTDDPERAMGDLAKAYRRRFSIPVVAITGSNGKTTTKDMTAAVLASRYRVLATEGNLNTRQGVPLTLFGLSKGHEVAVIEMGISEHGGLRYLCEIADPTVGVITNIGPTHLEFLGSVEGVAKAKGELLEYLDESSMTILNLDDLLLSRERAKVKGRLLGFGIEKICQFRGEGLVQDQEGCGHFSLQGHCFRLSIPGRHNVYNALAAAAVGAALDVPVADAAAALADFRPTSLRSQVEERDGVRLLNDSYNANPASMRSALQTLAQISTPRPDGRRVAVLGDMLELGPCAPEAHRELGRFAAREPVSALFALGELAEEVAEGGKDEGLPPERSRAFADRDELIQVLESFVKPGDLVLIKGSRGMAMEAVAHALGFGESSEEH